MKIKLYVLILFSLFFLNIVHAQDLKYSNTQTDISSLTFLDRTEFKVNYFGNIFWNNGFEIGGEYLLIEKLNFKERKRGSRTNIHEFLLNTNLGFTTNLSSKTDTGVFINSGLIWRRTNKKGKQFSIELNPLGYYRSFLPETYKVEGDDVDRVFMPGRSYYAPSISVGIGKERKDKKLTGRYFNINLMLRTPYNTGTLPSFSFQYGYRFNIKKRK